jgi:sporulation protein YlmC with PRC-barrel domain
MKRFTRLAIFLGLALMLMACQMTQQISKQISKQTSKQTAIPGSEVTATASLSKATPTDKVSPTEHANPVAWKKPVQSQAAGIHPADMRTKLTHLTNLIGYEVVDAKGDKLGVASDYIVNTCETYIIYILMQPDASLDIASGNLVVIPFEAVTINSGVLDAQKKSIQLQLSPDQFKGAPTLTPGEQLTPTDWEGGVRDFWMKSVRIGVLQTSCNTSGGPSYKVAYATQLLGVKLYDGRKALLGTVEDAILEPESGQFSFYIVKPETGKGLVMVPMGNTNIPKEALAPGGTLTLVLLAQPDVFWGAPRITSAGQADDFNTLAKMRGVWGK